MHSAEHSSRAPTRLARLRWLLFLMPCLAVVAALSRPPPKPLRGEHLAPLLPQKELLLVLGGGYRPLLADYFWIQTIQATGVAVTSEEYRDIYYYADMTTEIDPDFEYVYIFAGAAVTYNFGREHWVNTEEARALLEKGVKRLPRSVYMRVMLAYNLSYFFHEYKRAAEILRETARRPRAPAYLSALATRLYAQAGDFDDGLALAQSLVESAEDPDSRATFERRVKEILLERELKAVDEAAARYRARHGALPKDVSVLVTEGDLAKAPADPLEGTITIDANGRGQSSSEDHRLEVYK